VLAVLVRLLLWHHAARLVLRLLLQLLRLPGLM
jgi:hypothetical protein